MKFFDELLRVNACDEALDWAKSLPDEASPEDAWLACPSGEWLLWYCEQIGLGEDPAVRRAGLACARTALQYVEGTKHYDVAAECIEVYARFLGGDATEEEQAAARAAAWDAARAAAWDAAWDAASAAAGAAVRGAAGAAASAVARAAASAAASAAAGAAAGAAASAAAWDAARGAARNAARSAARGAANLEHADIVHEMVPWEVVRKATLSTTD